MLQKDLLACCLTSQTETREEANAQALALDNLLEILPSVRAALVISGYNDTVLIRKFYAATIALKESFGLSLDEAERKAKAAEAVCGSLERSIEHEAKR